MRPHHMKVTSSLERIANSCLLSGVSDDWELARLRAVTKAAEGCQGEQRHSNTLTETHGHRKQDFGCSTKPCLHLRFLIKKKIKFLSAFILKHRKDLSSDSTGVLLRRPGACPNCPSWTDEEDRVSHVHVRAS